MSNLVDRPQQERTFDAIVVGSGISGGYAANLGLQPGDFIRQVNGVRITTTAQLAQVLLMANELMFAD